jgi:hypothetical protein
VARAAAAALLDAAAAGTRPAGPAA